jgi:hypothetical protein
MPYRSGSDQALRKAMAGAYPRLYSEPSTWFNQERYNDNPLTWTAACR